MNAILQKAHAMASRSDLEVAIDTCRSMIEKRLIVYCPTKSVKDDLMASIDHLVGLNRTHAADAVKHLEIADECGL